MNNRISHAVIATVIGCLVVACGDSGKGQEGAPNAPVSAEIEPAASAEPALLCESAAAEIQALTPAGAEPLNTPGLAETWTSRMCIVHYGIDAPVQQIRDFYARNLADQGFELSQNEITDGAMRGNESRTFIRGATSNRMIILTVDEFSQKTPARPYLVTIQLQLDSS